MDDTSFVYDELCNDEELCSKEGLGKDEEPDNNKVKALFKADICALDDETCCPDHSFCILSSGISILDADIVFPPTT